MNRHVVWTLTLTVGMIAAPSAQAQNRAGAVRKPATQPAPAQAAPAPLNPQQQAAIEAQRKLAEERMNAILAEWEVRSSKITSLDAVFDMINRNPGFGDQWYRGRAMLQSPDKCCLQFQLYKLDDDRKPIKLTDDKGKQTAKLEKEPEKRIVCTGTEVLQYMWQNRVLTVYPLDKQARQKALQEGPLPFLFNMKAAEAKQRYVMRLYREFPGEYVIDIDPRMEIDGESFMQARLWLNKETFLPNQLWLVKPGGKEREEYKFNDANDKIVVNSPMDQKFFTFQNFQGWKTVVNKPVNEKPPGAAQAPRGAAVPRQQATQPGTRVPR